MIQILGLWPDEIAFYVHVIQSIVHPTHNVIIIDTLSIRAGCLFLDSEPVQSSKCFIADQYCHFIFLLQVNQMFSKAGKLVTNYAGFPVSGILLKIMTKNSLPVGSQAL